MSTVGWVIETSVSAFWVLAGFAVGWFLARGALRRPRADKDDHDEIWLREYLEKKGGWSGRGWYVTECDDAGHRRPDDPERDPHQMTDG